MFSRFSLFATFIGVVSGILPALTFASPNPESRMAIIRGLTAEYANTRVPLPRGKKGLTIKADGQVDQESLKREITQYGTACAANTLVQITAIQFGNKHIMLEINGGGKKKTKWYEHIEVGMGTGTQPIGQTDTRTPTGSAITLMLPKKTDDLTVAEVKTYLAPVLDFDPKSPLQTPSRPVPPQFQQAVKDKKAVPGMDREMVIAAMGQPQRKVREIKDGVEQEDWIYGTPPLKTTFVTFEGDEVVQVQDYTGGVGGQVQPSSETIPH